jgi:hypothetical protein
MRRLLGVVAALAVLVPAAAVARPAAMHPELAAKLLGRNEVPKVPGAGHGIVNLTLSSAKGTVCWTFELVGVAKPAAAHIHKGRAGKSGPVFIPLGRAYRAKGCQKASKAMLDAVESNPNAFYVNVHNSRYPNGAVRGQLVAGMMHM